MPPVEISRRNLTFCLSRELRALCVHFFPSWKLFIWIILSVWTFYLNTESTRLFQSTFWFASLFWRPKRKPKWNIENPFWKTFTVCSLLQEIPFVFSRLWVKWQGQTVWCLFYFKCVNSLLVLSQQNFWGTIHALLDCDHVKTETLASWCGFKWTRVFTLTKPGFWDFTVWIKKILQII